MYRNQKPESPAYRTKPRRLLLWWVVFAFACLVTAGLSWQAAVPAMAQEREPAELRAVFLGPETPPETFYELLSHPSLLADRAVQMKIFQSLGSADLAVFQAAVGVCLKAPQLEDMPLIGRRLSQAFISRDARRKQAILELAGSDPSYLDDLRVISLVAAALTDPDAELPGTALSLVKKESRLMELPAVAEALDRTGESLERPRVPIPDQTFFVERVLPVLEAPGSDGKACVECHKTHTIMQLFPTGEAPPGEDAVLLNYRSSLRVIDLDDPESSLLLEKPLSPEPPEGAQGIPPGTHGGGERWPKGSEEYQALLEWIRTAR